MEVTKAENLLKHREEIYARPARTWFKNKSGNKPQPKKFMKKKN
jgi:hypothetical protein